jgi:RNA polymerase sigma factor, sigma-70 family
MYDFETIFQSFQEGDIAPFYRCLYPGLLICASRYLGPDLAYLSEDCVQDAVMDSYVIRYNFESARAWYRYVMKCIYTRCLGDRRKLLSHHNYVESGAHEVATPAFDSVLLERETMARLYTAIQSLSDLQKDILRMSFSEGLKNAEIAQRLGIAEITVKKHKARLLAVLRGKLDDIPSALIIWILCDGIA